MKDDAWAYLLRLLSRRPRTTAELHRRLAAKGFPPQTVRTAVTRAVEEGLVDDRAFARLYAEDRLLSRPCSRRLLREELKGHGLDLGLAEEAARTALGELGEEDLARRALAQRRPLWHGLSPDVAARRAHAFLLRRGFPPDLARRLAEEAFGVKGEWTSA
ncbi:MAG: RecX family transcriptional regulator [Candidatus Acetothermia bacterium]|jgi:regulatory protein|nr:RecX family transcriptional regulator [Candidatus Acetothermia bacterium]